MAKFWDALTQIQHAPVFLIAVIDLIFLITLLIVFKTHTPPELQTVIKDAFIGWNGALAIAINVVRKDPPSLDEDGKVNASDPTPTVPIAAPNTTNKS